MLSRIRLYGALTLSMLIMLLTFWQEAFYVNHVSFAICVADVALIAAPFWLIRRRFWLTLIPVWGLALFLIANILNFRFWGEFLSFSALTMAQNVGGLLISSILGLLKWRDLVYLAIPLAFLYYVCGWKCSDCDSRRYATPVLISIGIFFVGQFGITLAKVHWQKSINIPSGSYIYETAQRIIPICSRINYFQSNGLSVYVCKNAVILFRDLFSSGTLTDSRKKEIAEYIDRHNTPHTDGFTQNCNKNLVIIVVESLNAEVINKTVNGFEISPHLNSLLRADGSISCLQVVPQIKDGGSSDGQMLINTGLLPLKDGCASMRYGSTNTYPSIVKELGYEGSLAIFGDDGIVWNQTGAFKSYGFSKILYSKHFITPIETRGRDGAMFDLALAELKTLKQPFILECITNSMHIPFQEECVVQPSRIADAGINETEKSYFTITNYFDTELARFLTELYKVSPKENTIVVITSDHSQSIATGSVLSTVDDTSVPAVFIAANTGVTASIGRIIGQVNIYPTILDIMGLDETHSDYRGLGSSMLMPIVSGAVDVFGNNHGSLEDGAFSAIDISDDIIKSNYFGNK